MLLSVVLKKPAQIKQSPNYRKFAQSGHPGDEYTLWSSFAQQNRAGAGPGPSMHCGLGLGLLLNKPKARARARAGLGLGQSSRV
jgi:hypothetical protein